MDTLTFVSKLAEYLAWPIAAVILVRALRAEIRQLVPNLKKLKAGPVEAEFERELQKLTEAAEEQTDVLPPPERPSTEKQMLLQLVQINPRSAILEAWRGIEQAKVLAKSYRSTASLGSPPRFEQGSVQSVSTESLLTGEEHLLYVELRGLRNKAAHSQDFSPTAESAIRYIELAGRIRSAFER